MNAVVDPARPWRIALTVPPALIPPFEEVLSPFGFAISNYEADGDRAWTVEVLTDAPPDRKALRDAVRAIADGMAIAEPVLTVERLPARDWVSHTNKLLSPVRAGRFHLYGAHDAGSAPPGSIALLIDAGQAFGTGRAPSTFGCLQAIGFLARQRRIRRVLDMGCGSGVLAMAASRACACPVIASDIDPVAVRVALENVRLNGCRARVKTLVSRGFQHRQIGQGAPYDLIVANILAEPLTRFATVLARHLAPGGHVILSGLLAREERFVRARYRAENLRLVSRIVREGWTTLILAAGR